MTSPERLVVDREERPESAEPVSIRMPVDVRNAALTIVATVAVVTVLRAAAAMLIPIVLGILISYALDPAVTWFERRHVPRPLSAAILLVALVAGTCWLIYGLRFEGQAIVNKLPEAARRIRRTFEDAPPTTAAAIQQMQKAATELEKAASAAATPPPAPSGVTRVQVEAAPINITDYLLWGSIGAVAAIGQVLLVLFLVYFLLASGDLYKRKLVKIVGPSLTKKKLTVQILEDIDRQIEMFLLVEVLTSTIVGVCTWLALRWLGLEQAAVWGIAAGVLNSIPYFGPFVVTAGTATVAFLQFGSIRMAVLVSLVTLVITTLEGLLLTPWLTSRAARMNAVAIFVGLLFWGWVWGVWGMLLAVPMLVVIKSICDQIEDFKPFGEMLGE